MNKPKLTKPVDPKTKKEADRKEEINKNIEFHRRIVETILRKN